MLCSEAAVRPLPSRAASGGRSFLRFVRCLVLDGCSRHPFPQSLHRLRHPRKSSLQCLTRLPAQTSRPTAAPAPTPRAAAPSPPRANNCSLRRYLSSSVSQHLHADVDFDWDGTRLAPWVASDAVDVILFDRRPIYIVSVTIVCLWLGPLQASDELPQKLRWTLANLAMVFCRLGNTG
ncbi:uncharacterized protein C8Q71DRAFT_14969 [Rhodofomes roseus]|uniref:Uncharacterized protein n=1 Tax=Rhodofomes roseus TaxID=34475 RepID=A0ABQ8KX84_9APHY|nr:uncharacterized protein C8Q71DRAFT_14969 [Rhodofomes roseus]KAH9843826.1 hypothetical protein C8Q71DRAFT_14969 [Rhodofomes roseus]